MARSKLRLPGGDEFEWDTEGVIWFRGHAIGTVSDIAKAFITIPGTIRKIDSAVCDSCKDKIKDMSAKISSSVAIIREEVIDFDKESFKKKKRKR